MDPPANDAEHVPEKKTIDDGKDKGPAFHCDFYDMEIVYKISQVFLPGLSAACVDNTTGGIFKSPGLVAVEIRKEMIDYLTQRSESFVAESIILEGGGGPETEVSDHPYDIISDFVDDFASSKRNFFSRVSGWLLSEKREDKIDDLVQEMEENGFWLMDRREAIAQTLLKNVDFTNKFHCDEKFNTEEELLEHTRNCGFRTMNCRNDGCTAIFSASHAEKHDAECPFKIIPCEQKCSNNIKRREMDRHCITVCPMKLVNCPFYSVGCQSTIPQSKLPQHRSDEVQSHIIHILRSIHKEAAIEDLRARADQILQESNASQLAQARELRTLTNKVKEIETKIGPLEVRVDKKVGEESTKPEDCTKENSSDAGNKVDKQMVPEDNKKENSNDAVNKFDKQMVPEDNIKENSSVAINKVDKQMVPEDNTKENSSDAVNKVVEQMVPEDNTKTNSSDAVNKVDEHMVPEDNTKENSSDAVNKVDKQMVPEENTKENSSDAVNKVDEQMVPMSN